MRRKVLYLNVEYLSNKFEENAFLKLSGKYITQNMNYLYKHQLSNDNLVNGHLVDHKIVTGFGRSSRNHGGSAIFAYVNNNYDTTVLDKVNNIAVEFHFEMSAVR